MANEKEKLINAYRMWTAYQPAFTTWNGALYESDLIRAAIGAKARNAAKLKIDIYGSAESPLKTRLKRNPNPLQTWSQFLSRATTIFEVENSVIIMPWYDGNEVIGHMPVPVSQCQFSVYDGRLMIVYMPESGASPMAAEFAECGVVVQHQYKNDVFGANNRPLNPTLEMLNLQKQGIEEAVKNSATYRFMARFTEAVFSEDLKDERKNFTQQNLSGDDGNDGLLLFPNSYNDIRQVESKQYVLDDKQMNYIRENVFNYFGVNDKVLRNEAYGDDWIAFYEGAIEPFAIQLAEVYERMLFTDLERANGNGVMFAISRLEHLPDEVKIAKAHESVDRGMLSVNEARAIAWGLPPREGGDTYAIRGEYKNTEDLTNEN